MGNKQAQRRVSARRAAALLAALGALVMSSGVALMVAATPANAIAVKPSICHPVNGKGELGNGWNLISPDKASSHIDESKWPDGHYWKHESKDGLRHDMYAINGTCPGEPVTPDTCPEGTAHAGDQVPGGQTAEDYCNDEEPPAVCPEGTDNSGDAIPEGQTADQFCNDDEPPVKEQLTPQAPGFTDPTCATDPGVSLPTPQILLRTAGASLPSSVVVNGIRYTATGNLVPGGTVEVNATLVDPENTQFGESQTHWSHTFPVPAGCTQVSPPQTESQVVVNSPKTKAKTKTKAEAVVTPTLVEAGLAGTSAQDLRGEQGLALMVAGMVMLVGAAGLGLRVRGAAARS